AASLDRALIATYQLVRVAIAQIAFGATWQALQVEGWSDEQLALLQEGWQRHDFLLPFERAITMERAMTDLELNRLRTSLGGAGWLSGGGGAPAAATSANFSFDWRLFIIEKVPELFRSQIYFP